MTAPRRSDQWPWWLREVVLPFLIFAAFVVIYGLAGGYIGE